MDQTQFQKLKDTPNARVIVPLRGYDLENQTPRTLLLGYTLDGYTFHVYLDEQGIIQKVVYSGVSLPMLIVHSVQTDIADDNAYAPNKRIYPEASDYEFCMLLKERRICLAYSTFNEERDLSQAFHGKRLVELHQPGGSVEMVRNR